LMAAIAAADRIAACDAVEPSNPTTIPPIDGVSNCHCCSEVMGAVLFVTVSSAMRSWEIGRGSRAIPKMAPRRWWISRQSPELL